MTEYHDLSAGGWRFVRRAVGNGIPNMVAWRGWLLATNGHCLAYLRGGAVTDLPLRVRLDPKHSAADPEAVLTFSVDEGARVLAPFVENEPTRELARAKLNRGTPSLRMCVRLRAREVVATLKADFERFRYSEEVENYTAQLWDWDMTLRKLQAEVEAARRTGRRDGLVGDARERIRVHRVRRPEPPKHTIELQRVGSLFKGTWDAAYLRAAVEACARQGSKMVCFHRYGEGAPLLVTPDEEPGDAGWLIAGIRS